MKTLTLFSIVVLIFLIVGYKPTPSTSEVKRQVEESPKTVQEIVEEQKETVGEEQEKMQEAQDKLLEKNSEEVNKDTPNMVIDPCEMLAIAKTELAVAKGDISLEEYRSLKKEWKDQNIGKTRAKHLYLKDLEDIDLSGLTVQSYGDPIYINFGIEAYTIEYRYEKKGAIGLDMNEYHDMYAYNDYPVSLLITKSREEALPDIYAGDYITITYDGGNTKNIYLPRVCTDQLFLYIGDDGSTYYDRELISLAQSVP